MSDHLHDAFPVRPSGFLVRTALLGVWILLSHQGCGTPISGEPRQDGHAEADAIRALEQRFEPPSGFQRVAVGSESFGAWLRRLPVRPGRPRVQLYNGLPKFNQRAHHAVIAIDVGDRDLQQCADAVIRLRAEYLRARDCEEAIAFRFTSGDPARWTDWRLGSRPRVRGNQVSWHRTGAVDGGYASFRKYLEVVFTYAGSASLEQELRKVDDPSRIRIGDVFIQGGFPGHAVLVVDLVENARGERLFLLAQSYMPAQEVHVLRHPGGRYDPWYEVRSEGELETPEWEFRYGDLKRFPEPAGCVSQGSAVDFGSHPWEVR
ncbi:MAG: DUF4846 domain-containing protein [bacterium]|nr:DUF4846 domain-containing protein [bacterium]